MDAVTLGGSGLEVSPIAFGTWQLSGDWGGADERPRPPERRGRDRDQGWATPEAMIKLMGLA